MSNDKPIGDNNKPPEDKQPVQPLNTEPKTVIVISLHPDGHMELKSSMQPPMVVYTLEQMKTQILTSPTNLQDKPKIIKPHGVMNFVSRGFRR